MKIFNTIRSVAAFEAAKGLVVLLAGFGALSIIHHDVCDKPADRWINDQCFISCPFS